jgi:hypothetical protein
LHLLAKNYLSAIDEIMIATQQDIYHLFGWSLGGQIALEIASILEQRGKSRIIVYLLDTLLKDQYLTNLMNSLDSSKLKDDIRNSFDEYHDESYIERVVSNTEVEAKLSSQGISSMLTETNALLFKAILEDTRIDAGLARAVHEHTSKLKYNNIDKIFKNKSNIRVIEINNAHHGNIIRHEELLISEIEKKAFL